MKLFITGDFCPINRADISHKTTKELLSNDLKILIESADFAITNLECPLTNHEISITKTGPTLKANPKNVLLLKRNKFNLVTLANNHIMDYGSEGLKETILHLKENGIGYLGAGKSNDEIEVIYKTKEGFTIAIINVCENEWSTQEREGYKAYGFSEIDMFYTINKAKSQADKVIVIHHGGHEMYNLPSPRLKKTLRFLVDCGASAVINHHTHCISGEEIYRNAPIFYSLGNFVFDSTQQRNTIWNFGMAVSLNCTKKEITYEKHYFEQFNENEQVKLVDKSDLLYHVENLNSIISDDIKLSEYFDTFIKTKHRLYSSYLEPVKSKYLLFLINRGFLPSLWNKTKKRYLKNLISCESHREAVQTILNDNNHF